MTTFASNAESRSGKVNKLLYMYNFYYLPYSVEFREGRTINDILPFMPGKFGDPGRLLTAEELQTLDREWSIQRESLKTKSILNSTPVSPGSNVRISNRIVSHRIPLTRGAFDTLPITDRIQLNDVLKGKTPEVQAAFKQLRFLKSFLTPLEEEKFNFFLISASWCESCREYRILFETYFKMFPNADVGFHSVVIDDPNEQIFESRILKELFPNPERYSHDSIPRFLAVETVGGKSTVFEEGEALLEIYERFFKKNRGYLDGKSSVFRGFRSTAGKLDPSVSSLAK